MNTKKFSRRIRTGLSRVRGVIDYNLTRYVKPLTPKEMIINITYWCNSRCTMCNIWKMRPKHELSYGQWKRAMEDSIFADIEALTISGGEPTLHKDFNRLAVLYMDSMPKLRQLTVITNGFVPTLIVTKLTTLAAECDRRGIHMSISVSLDGVETMHEKVRRIPKGFFKTTTTLFELMKLQEKYDVYVGVGSLVLRQNIREVEKMKQWCEQHDVPYNFQIVGFHEVFLQNMDSQEKVDFREKDQKKLLEFLEKRSKPKSVIDFGAYYWADMLKMYRDGRDRRTPCPFLHDQFVIDSFGDVYYCLSAKSVGNWVKEKRSIGEIYYDAKNQNFRRKMPSKQCRKCNSGCNVEYAISKDLKKYLWFLLTGRT